MKLNRRNLIKNGLLTLGGIGLAPHLMEGAFAATPMKIDAKNRLIYSPFMHEHFIEESFNLAPILKAKLNANENPYGPPLSAQNAIKEAVVGGNRYAWKEMSDLISKISKKEGVPADHIMMGPGSSDLLEKVAIVLFMNGGNIVSADPTYMSLIKVAESVGAEWKAVPCKKDWSHDLKAMEAAIDKDTKLVYICNPNNPTGTLTPIKELEDFCSRVSEKVPIFIDEAYLELASGDTESMVSLLSKKKNVIIARTFSKVMGMAGIRVGYIAALPSFLEQINKITRGGMGISLPSILGATAAIEDKEFQDMTIRLNKETKEYVYSELTKMGYTYLPSYTNFILFPIKMNGKEMLKKMSEKGVGVRSFDIFDQTYCRVSMGTMDEMKMFTKSFSELS
ncbi:histidinol-phosphate transaminase [Lacihabitans sp. LS3-19]|uniref:pyridoxal phosphate-dependent aminotransferase n=1 Tax=Lacihabitans sp. LS3-19 TaxID=2487335 RepID=UPI0021D42CDD|nr:histidinol-phosphate transaminase [Lacihabitans sp. LS3-19]